jgi:hypothetical protein
VRSSIAMMLLAEASLVRNYHVSSIKKIRQEGLTPAQGRTSTKLVPRSFYGQVCARKLIGSEI